MWWRCMYWSFSEEYSDETSFVFSILNDFAYCGRDVAKQADATLASGTVADINLESHGNHGLWSIVLFFVSLLRLGMFDYC